MKAKIILKEKNGDKVITFINNIFDSLNGIAFFSIEKDVWDLVDFKKSSEFNDVDGNELFEGDNVMAKTFPEDGHSIIYGTIVFDQGAFCIDIKISEDEKCGYDVEQKIPLYKFEMIQKLS